METASLLKPGAVALVTGASVGIGKAIAMRLLEQDARLIAVARNRERLEAVFSDHGDSVHVLPLDVTDGPAVAGLIDNLPGSWRDIDVLIANAASDVGGRQPFCDGDGEDWASTVETNINGVVRVCHTILPGMLARGRGHVVIVGSVDALGTRPGASIYAATKHAVHALADGLRRDYVSDPVRITEILPGLVRTGFAEARFRGDAERADAYYESFPAYLDPDDIARSTMFALNQPDEVNVAQMVIVPTGYK